MSARKKKSSAAIVALLILAAVGVAGVCYFVYVYFQVEKVDVAGNAYYTSAYVRALADIPQGTHMLQVDKNAITANIQTAEPHLRVVAVTRTLPDTVVIEVEERRPAAVLPYGTEYLLIDINTVVLEAVPEAAGSGCPEVLGISITGVEVGSPIKTDDTFKISVMQEILTELYSRELYPMIATVDLSNINNIRLTSTNGLTIRFGQADQIADKVKWIKNRLPALEREGQTLGILDVSAGSFATYTMYSNGTDLSQPTASASPGTSGGGQGMQGTESASPQPGDTGEGTGNGDAAGGSGQTQDPDAGASSGPSAPNSLDTIVVTPPPA